MSTILKEKWPYLWKTPTNLPLHTKTKEQKEWTEVLITSSLNWNNPVFRDIKITMMSSLSFSWNWWALWPLNLTWDKKLWIRSLNKSELVEVCYILERAILNKNPKHDSNIYHLIIQTIIECLELLWVKYELKNISYNDFWHKKSIDIPMPV